jgi:hypothetical protein
MEKVSLSDSAGFATPPDKVALVLRRMFEQETYPYPFYPCPQQGYSQSQDGKPPACVSLLNMVDVSKNMTKTSRNYTTGLPVPARNKQDRTTSHRPLLFPMPLLVWSVTSIHAAGHPACLRFSHV